MVEAYPVPVTLVSNERLPLVANSRVVCGDKITLKLEHLAVCSWLERFVVEGDIPYLERVMISMVPDGCISDGRTPGVES